MAAGECEHDVVSRWEPTGLSDDQPVSRGGDEGGSAGGVQRGAGVVDRRGVCEVGELFCLRQCRRHRCGWDENWGGCESAQGGVGEEDGEVQGPLAGEDQGAVGRDRAAERTGER